MKNNSDILIIGGGIVGLATAYRLMNRFPDKSISILEKEAELGFHQTGHNSGVLHTGIYYKPGSLKAINCRAGKQAMEEFCTEHGIDFEICGKVIVATDELEIPRMQGIYERGQQNGVSCRLISAEECQEIEPHANAVAAIHVPEAGIVNFKQVCRKLGELIEAAGNQVLTSTRLTGLQRRDQETIAETNRGEFKTTLLVNCGGLHSDRITRMSGQKPAAMIVPFRGEYYELKPKKHYLCKSLIYPVPDPQYPFLGVHFTRMIDGGVECGPNAVLAFAREGYSKYHINPADLIESVTYPGFLHMTRQHWRMGLGELWRSYNKSAFVKALQRLMPEITVDDLTPCSAGIRAQAITPKGGLVDDFLIQESEAVVNVNNAPSPAATASLNIGTLIADKLSPRLAAV